MKLESPTQKTELLAPAGSLETGLTAFAAGADAVYVGLPRFSARKNAVNLSFDDLRRLKTAALQQNGHIYLAVNTVVKQDEFSDLLPAVQEAVWAGADALIVQDIGVARLIQETFPKLPLHASTQMAIHNAAGIREARCLGFSRVVLARECGLTTIEKLRQECLDMELEVFIHGALCYSFSGICLASGLLLGRSGNRGECAQLCRNWYQTDQGKAFALSCNDLALEDDVAKLRTLGVRSLKIEGRMKNAAYVHHTVKFYRDLLDKKTDDEEAFKAGLARSVALTFQRQKTKGYFSTPNGQHLIDPHFSEHKGLQIGQVRQFASPKTEHEHEFEIELTLQEPLSRHDSLQIFPDSDGLKVVRSSAREISLKQGSSWKSIIHAKAGETVRIRIQPSPQDKVFNDALVIPAGSPVFLTHSTELRTPSVARGSFKPWKTEVSLDFSICSETHTFPDSSARIEWRLDEKQDSLTVTLDRAKNPKEFAPLLGAAIREQGDSPFGISISKITNTTRLDDHSLFIPPSELKILRNHCHAFVQEWAERRKQELAHAPILSQRKVEVPDLSLKERSAYSPIGRDSSLPVIPFFDEEDLEAMSSQRHDRRPSILNGNIHFPLSPIIFDENNALASLRKIVASSPSPITLGLNNIAHVEWLRTLLTDFGASRVRWWLDCYFYAANASVLHSVMDCLGPDAPLPMGQLPWIEDDSQRENARFLPFMISMGCLTRHESGESRCPADCTRQRLMTFKNGSQKFNIRIHHCRTYIFGST